MSAMSDTDPQLPLDGDDVAHGDEELDQLVDPAEGSVA
jgi:hypothetical protein